MGQGQSSNKNPDVSPAKSFPSTDTGGSDDGDQPIYPSPSGNQYDEIDKIQAELPSIIDEESQQQVDDYIQACDNGKGPMVACFATGEYISMFERKVRRWEKPKRAYSSFEILNVVHLNILSVVAPRGL